MPDKWAQYAQPAGDKWAQYAQTESPEAAPEGNAVQRFFDKLTTVTPEQEKTPSWMGPTVGSVVNQAQKFGAGAIQGATEPLIHPVNTLSGLGNIFIHPEETAKGAWESAKENPAQTIGNIVGGTVAGMGAAEGAAKILPSRIHAANTFRDIESQAHDVPVSMENTQPALQEFRQHVATGGKNAPVMQQLRNRITPRMPKVGPLERMESELNGTPIQPQAQPIFFPEARKFYTNVTDVTRPPGMFRKAFESPREPRLRAAAGPVKEALNTDLTNAAESIGRGEDYQGAMREYARAARLRDILRKGAVGAAPVAAGAVGARKLHDILAPVVR